MQPRKHSTSSSDPLVDRVHRKPIGPPWTARRSAWSARRSSGAWPSSGPSSSSTPTSSSSSAAGPRPSLAAGDRGLAPAAAPSAWSLGRRQGWAGRRRRRWRGRATTSCSKGLPSRDCHPCLGGMVAMAMALNESVTPNVFDIIVHQLIALAGRSTQLLYETVQQIRRQQPDARLEAFQLDLASYKSIKKFGTSLKQWIQETSSEPAIQLLINNAGILAKLHRVTGDGLDEMIQINYIGPFILTSIILPLLKNSSVPSRVVNLTSFTHRCVSGIDVSEDALRGMKFGLCSVGESYLLASTYEYTKLCILMFSYELHRQFHMSSAISVIAADPGVVETKIMRELPKCLSWFAFLVLRFLNLLQEPDTGVGSVLDAALAPPEESGKYFFGGKGRTIRSSQLSYNTEIAKKLWAEPWAVFKDPQLRKGDFRNG